MQLSSGVNRLAADALTARQTTMQAAQQPQISPQQNLLFSHRYGS